MIGWPRWSGGSEDSVDRRLPTWVDTIISRLAAMFSLQHWRIQLYPENAVNKPSGCESASGVADMDTNYHDAKIFLSRDLDQDTFGFEVIAHEVLHLVFSDMRNTVSDITKFVFDEDQRKVLFDIYDRVEEQTITRLARGMARDFDFSFWLKDKPEPKPEPEPETVNSSWWLISEDDVNTLRALLDELGRRGREGAGVDALRYTLDTGLHTTDAVPADFAEDGPATLRITVGEAAALMGWFDHLIATATLYDYKHCADDAERWRTTVQSWLRQTHVGSTFAEESGE